MPIFWGGIASASWWRFHAAGVLDEPALAELSCARGRLMSEAGRGTGGAMAAVLAGSDEVERLIRDVAGVQAANRNGPRQTVIAGPSAAVREAISLAATRGISCRILPVSCAFHTPLVGDARAPFVQLAVPLLRRSPARPVYSNLDAQPHPADPETIARRLGEHLTSPVRFLEMIDAMYRDGARVFVEVGPAATLAPLVESILGDRAHLAVSCDASGTSGLLAWMRALARLVVAGLPLRLDELTSGRSPRMLDLERLPARPDAEPTTSSSWLVNGSRARPINEPEPGRLGQRRERSLPEAQREPRAAFLADEPARAAAPRERTPSNRKSGIDRSLAAGARLTDADGMIPHSLPGRNGDHDSNAANQPAFTQPAASDRVIESFQQTMRTFLEVQKSTMLAYLAGRGGARLSESPAPRPQSDRRLHRDSFGKAAPAPASAAGTPPAAPGFVVRGTSSGLEPDDAKAHLVTGDLIAARDTNDRTVKNNGAAVGPTGAAVSSGGVAPPDRAVITARLLETVRDRTGYPIETLGMDLDMEADLGIDSIKRVEILGKLRDEFPSLKGLSESAEMMDALARARTLGVIVEKMAAVASESRVPDTAPEPAVAAQNGAVASGNGKPYHAATARRLLEVVDAPLPDERLALAPGGPHLDHGRRTRRGRPTGGCGLPRPGSRWIELAAARHRSIGARRRPSIRSSIDCGQMDHSPESFTPCPLGGRDPAIGTSSTGRHAPPWISRDCSCWRKPQPAISRKPRAQAAHAWSPQRLSGVDSRARAARVSTSFLVTAESPASSKPSRGSGPRFVAASSISPQDAREDALAARLADEVFVCDGFAEVGYDHDRRIRLRTALCPLVREAPRSSSSPVSQWSFPVERAASPPWLPRSCARTWRPTLLIVGTTPLPGESEHPETAGMSGETEIKAALHARLRREGRPASPSQIETIYQGVRRAREVRENLEILRNAGSTVAYAEADVRDARALAHVLDDWRGRYGAPVGLIHGAGLIKDKLIRHKTVESFDRVLETKLDGALNLIRLVNPGSVKFTALFSSIAGRFGNVGQSDYAAANEILNKLAHWLDRRWPGRVLSLIWGPWSGVGMVSQLESHLGRRGLGMISPDVGPSLLIDELRFGRKGEVEVIYAGKLGTLEQPLSHVPAAEPAEAAR